MKTNELRQNRVVPKVWLITGCSTGFGRLAEAVLKGDLLATRKPEQLRALMSTHPDRKGCTSGCNVKTQAAVDTAIATFGRIDVVVNNAGHGLRHSKKSVMLIHQYFETNFFGALRRCELAGDASARQRTL